MRSDIKAASNKTGPYFGPFKKALNAVEGLLQNGETVAAVSSARYEKTNGVAAVTNRRVLFVRVGLLGGVKTSTVLLSAITGVERRGGRIMIRSTGGDTELSSVSGPQLLEAAISNGGTTPAAPLDRATVTQPKPNKVEAGHEKALAEIGRLLDSGEITPEEYAKRRQKLQAIMDKA
ncbi:SHOCT domain-containing protein [Nocardiopsis rhodophaea]|uniref:SHOCT domain-containing protein n=1 Tax=Nocardiopsis rhodophaea TaxID=280238 RepID=UPI0031E0A1CA